MKYAAVNGQWPEGKLPPLTPQEAMSAARRLYRFGLGKPWTRRVKLTSGQRHTWIRWGNKPGEGRILFVNPDNGWHSLVHDLSHYVHRQKNPRDPSHGFKHAWIERTMIEHVVRSGWLEGKLKRPEKPKVPLTVQRHQRVLARLAQWKTKLKRAQTAVKKLEQQRRYYEQQALKIAA